jgi:predicted sulfurtransferase
MYFVSSNLIKIGLTLVCTLVLAIPAGINSYDTYAQTPTDGVPRITPAELRQVLKKKKAILIDVRNEDAYKAGHIKGALLIPASEIGSRSKDLAKGKLIATYCS